MISALVFSCTAALAAAVHPQLVLEEHPTVRFSENTFVLGRMRWSYEHRGPRASLPAGKAGSAFLRRRFSIEGGIGGLVEFEIETDLEGDERWKDVYVELTPGEAFHLRAGRFVIPFAYERTTSMDVLDFAYRAMASTQLVPPRDQGIAALGRIAGGKIVYDAGWFEDGSTVAARLVARRFAPGGWRGLEAGAAAMYGRLGTDIDPLAGRTALGHTFFRADQAHSGRRARVSVHGVLRKGPAALKAEYLAVHDDVDGGGDVDGRGWYVAGTYVLTGEDEADAHHPRRALFRGGFGSMEIAARVEALAFSDARRSRPRARADTLGVTWQPSRFFRVQWNAVRDVLPLRRMWTRVWRFQIGI